MSDTIDTPPAPTGLVYLLTFPNGKQYVGQTWLPSVDARYGGGSRISPGQRKLRNAVKKYGWENVTQEVLAHGVETQDELDHLEVSWIAALRTVEDGYNLSQGGRGGRHSEETKERMSAAAQRSAQDPAHRARNKTGARRRSQNPEWRARHKAAMQLLAQDPEWRARRKAAMQLLAQDPEWRARRKATAQRLTKSPEWQARKKAAAQRLAKSPEWQARNKAAKQHRAPVFFWNHPELGPRIAAHWELIARFPEQALSPGNLANVASGKLPHHKNWRCLARFSSPARSHLLPRRIERAASN